MGAVRHQLIELHGLTNLECLRRVVEFRPAKIIFITTFSTDKQDLFFILGRNQENF